jgi:hypothetical protein
LTLTFDLARLVRALAPPLAAPRRTGLPLRTALAGAVAGTLALAAEA